MAPQPDAWQGARCSPRIDVFPPSFTPGGLEVRRKSPAGRGPTAGRQAGHEKFPAGQRVPSRRNQEPSILLARFRLECRANCLLAFSFFVAYFRLACRADCLLVFSPSRPAQAGGLGAQPPRAVCARILVKIRVLGAAEAAVHFSRRRPQGLLRRKMCRQQRPRPKGCFCQNRCASIQPRPDYSPYPAFPLPSPPPAKQKRPNPWPGLFRQGSDACSPATFPAPCPCPWRRPPARRPRCFRARRHGPGGWWPLWSPRRAR